MAQRYHNGIPNEYLRMTGKSYMFAMRDKNFPRKFSDETKNIESQNEKSLIQKQISRTRHRATRVTTRTSNIPVRKERTSGVINKSLEKDLAPENALKSSVQSSRLNNQYQDQSVNNTSTPINPIPCINSNMDSKSKLITTKCQHSYAESYNVVKIPKKTSPTMKECDKVIQDIFQITRGGQNNRLARSNALSSGPRNDLNIASNFSKMKLSETLDSPNQGQSQIPVPSRSRQSSISQQIHISQIQSRPLPVPNSCDIRYNNGPGTRKPSDKLSTSSYSEIRQRPHFHETNQIR